MSRPRTPLRSALSIATALVLVGALAAGGAWLATGLAVGTGYAAKVVCSLVHDSGQDARRVVRDYVAYEVAPLGPFLRVEVGAAGAEASVLRLARARAVHRPGLGCTLVPEGSEATLALPQGIDARRPALPPDLPWSRGGAGPEAPAPPAAEVAIDRAFAEPDPTPGRLRQTTAVVVVHRGRLVAERYGATNDVSRMLFTQPDTGAFAARSPLAAAPDSVWSYSSGTSNLLARVLRDLLGGDLEALVRFARERHFDAAGMTSAFFEPDASGSFIGSSFAFATARDRARFGELHLRDGATSTNATRACCAPPTTTSPSAAARSPGATRCEGRAAIFYRPAGIPRTLRRGECGCGAVTKARTPRATRARPVHWRAVAVSSSRTKFAAIEKRGIEGTTIAVARARSSRARVWYQRSVPAKLSTMPCTARVATRGAASPGAGRTAKPPSSSQRAATIAPP